jgi:hypothetical protein
MNSITSTTISTDPQILQLLFRGHWTWNDLDAFIQLKPLKSENDDLPLYLIVDLTESDALPPSILVRAYDVLRLAPGNLRQIFVVSESVFVEGIVTTFQRVFNKYQWDFAVVATHAEAVHMIQLKTNKNNC